VIHTVGVGDMKDFGYEWRSDYNPCTGKLPGDCSTRSSCLCWRAAPRDAALSTIDPAKADRNPFMFVDTGFPRLLIDCFKAGAHKQRLEIWVAGGANSQHKEGNDFFQIGKRNLIILRKLLWKDGLLLKSYDVGGSNSRTMSLEIGTGRVTIKSADK